MKIAALVEHFAVNLGNQANRFLPALGKLLSTCYSTLCSAKTLLCLSQQTRITNVRSVVPRQERQQPDIQTNGPIVRWQWFRLYDATETGIPHAVLTLDGERSDLAFDRAVKLNLDVANLRKRQAATELEPGLRIGEGVVPGSRNESEETPLLVHACSEEKRPGKLCRYGAAHLAELDCEPHERPLERP